MPVALIANLAMQDEQAALIASEGGLKAVHALLGALKVRALRVLCVCFVTVVSALRE